MLDIKDELDADFLKYDDRTLLIFTATKMRMLCGQGGDHERRLRVLERFKNKVLGASGLVAVVITIIGLYLTTG